MKGVLPRNRGQAPAGGVGTGKLINRAGQQVGESVKRAATHTGASS